LSDGSPRQLEHPERKTEDIQALADFLKKGSLVEPGTRILALGICKGAAYSLAAAAGCEAIEGFIGISGFYFDEVSLEAESGYRQQRIDQGKHALQRYENEGEFGS